MSGQANENAKRLFGDDAALTSIATDVLRRSREIPSLEFLIVKPKYRRRSLFARFVALFRRRRVS